MVITFRDQESGKQGNITLDGNLTVGQAAKTSDQAIIDAEQVRLDFGTVTDVDLSCLQLLCSARRSASRMKKSISLSGDWPEVFKNTVEEAGYSRITGCRLDVDHSCLWVKK